MRRVHTLRARSLSRRAVKQGIPPKDGEVISIVTDLIPDEPDTLVSLTEYSYTPESIVSY